MRHVRLHAPLDERIERARVEQNISPLEAVALGKEKDKIRTSFIESFYHVPWDALHAFDIAINTAIVPIEMATGWVIEASKLRGVKPGDKPTTKQIGIDPVMQQAVAAKLNCSTEHA